MNKVMFLGNVVADIAENDVRYTQGENATCIVNFRIAVNKRFKNKNNSDAPTADFFRITAFGATAEFAKNYLKKGTKIVVEGRIENSNYKDQNGNMVYRDSIIADNIEFAEGRKDQSNAVNNTAEASAQGFMDIPKDNRDNLPFK